jgi:hypothetical protein
MKCSQLLTDCCVTASSDDSTVRSSGLQPIIRYLDHRFAPIEHPTSNVRILHRARIVRPQRSLDDAEHPSRACIDRRLSLIASGLTRESIGSGKTLAGFQVNP